MFKNKLKAFVNSVYGFPVSLHAYVRVGEGEWGKLFFEIKTKNKLLIQSRRRRVCRLSYLLILPPPSHQKKKTLDRYVTGTHFSQKGKQEFKLATTVPSHY